MNGRLDKTERPLSARVVQLEFSSLFLSTHVLEFFAQGSVKIPDDSKSYTLQKKDFFKASFLENHENSTLIISISSWLGHMGGKLL